MLYSEARQGRVFIIRLEDGDILHEEIERFAEEKSVRAATLIAVGGADEGSVLVVGPEEGRANPVTPMTTILDGVCEVAGVGTLFPNESGKPVLHMHAAFGRKTDTTTGCVRKGVKTWHILEVVMIELLNSTAVRKFDPTTGFELMRP
jgi:predicted DNA-binding protein with PD1-like motif